MKTFYAIIPGIGAYLTGTYVSVGMLPFAVVMLALTFYTAYNVGQTLTEC